MINLVCKTCNKTFEVKPCRKKSAKFCSHKCHGQSKKGQHISPATEFKKGHPATKGSFKKGQYVGSNHPSYKGGKIINKDGYTRILQPSHPNSDNKGYILRSHLVVEKHIDRFLRKGEVVHHINKNTSDDSLINLMCFCNKSAHIRFHHNPNNVKPEEIIFDGRNLLT